MNDSNVKLISNNINCDINNVSVIKNLNIENLKKSNNNILINNNVINNIICNQNICNKNCYNYKSNNDISDINSIDTTLKGNLINNNNNANNKKNTKLNHIFMNNSHIKSSLNNNNNLKRSTILDELTDIKNIKNNNSYKANNIYSKVKNNYLVNLNKFISNKSINKNRIDKEEYNKANDISFKYKDISVNNNSSKLNTNFNLKAEKYRHLFKIPKIDNFSSDEDIKEDNYIFNPWIIDHEKSWKQLFDTFIFFLIIYSCLVIPYRISRLNIDNFSLDEIYINVIVDIIFFIDLIFGFFTTYINKNKVKVIVLRKIALNYLKSWFIIDFISILPIDYFINYKNSALNSLTKVLKLQKLYRVMKISRYNLLNV